MKGWFKRLRGALGNALVWGASWGLVNGAFWAGVVFSGWGNVPVGNPWQMLGVVTLGGVASGFVTGLAFSVYLRLANTGGSVLGLSVGRSAAVGALVAASVPLLTNSAWMVLNGFSMPMGVLLSTAVMPFLLGGATAGGTVFAAKRDAARLADAAEEALEREQSEVEALLT